MGKFILSAFADEYADDFLLQLEALRKYNIDYTELRFIDKINIADLSQLQVKEAKQKLDAYGIGVSAIGSPIGKISLDSDLEAHFDKAKGIFETVCFLGVKNVRFFSFYAPKDKRIEVCREQIYSALEKLVSLSKQYGITLCHENEAAIYGESPEKCKELMEYFGGDIKCVFDMGNFVLDGYKPFPDGFRLLKDHIEYFHIKDALSAGAVVPPGKGEAEIPNILKAFSKYSKVDTFITLEPHLQTFSGINALVGKKFDNPYKYEDRERAFSDAVSKIKEILNSII